MNVYIETHFILNFLVGRRRFVKCISRFALCQ